LSTKKTKTIIKTIAFVIILFIDIALIVNGRKIDDTVEPTEDITYEVKTLEEDYYEQDFVSMMERIENNHLYKDDIKVYKEAMDAYILRMRCVIYSKANSMDEYNDAYSQLVDMANNCEPENKQLFAGFVSQVE